MSKMREQFEEWHRNKFKDRLQNGQPTRDMHNGKYAERYTVAIEQERWEVWQASRDELVVELPRRGYWGGYDQECYMEADEVEEAIHDAGVKTK